MMCFKCKHVYVNSYTLSLEKAMAPHSSMLAWKIPWTEEPGRLQPMGWRRVRHNWATSLSLFTLRHWRRKWQPTPVFLPGESQGRGSLVGCRLWGRTGSDTTEVTAAAAYSILNNKVLFFLETYQVSLCMVFHYMVLDYFSYFTFYHLLKRNHILLS